MILDKFRDRYSFNFLAISGLLLLLVFCIFVIPSYFEYCILPAFLETVIIASFTIILFVITVFVYIFEEIFDKKIKNEKFLNSKIILIMQILGLISMLIPILFVGAIFLIAIGKSIFSHLFHFIIKF